MLYRNFFLSDVQFSVKSDDACPLKACGVRPVYNGFAHHVYLVHGFGVHH